MAGGITPEISLTSIVFLLGGAQAVFLAVLLLRPGHANRYANRFLAVFLLVFALTLVDEFLLYTRYYSAAPQALGMLWPLDFLYGPLLYIYACALTSPLYRVARRQWLHFLPFAISVASHAPFILLAAPEKADLVFSPASPTPYHGVMALNTLGAMVQILVYLALVILRLRRHARSITQTLSWREDVDLRWLRNLAATCVGLWMLYVVHDLLLPLAGWGGTAYWLLPVTIACAVYTLGYLALRQPEIFAAPSPLDEGSGQAADPANGKYRKSALTSEQATAIHARLCALMDRAKPYRDGELTLSLLAQRLDVSVNHLSQVINERSGCNFFDFVNAYRIREVMRLLADPAEARSSILALSLEAGFKTKSAFYNAFRKHAGMTPAEYRASLFRVGEVSGPSL